MINKRTPNYSSALYEGKFKNAEVYVCDRGLKIWDKEKILIFRVEKGVLKFIEQFPMVIRLKMDKQIRKIEKDVKKKKLKSASKDLKKLEKEDKKRDKIVAVGKKAMKHKKKMC